MFGFKCSPNLAGPGFLVLNVIRVMNVIALLTITVASWIMIIMNIKTNHFYFFDFVSHLFASAVSTCLIISEIDVLPKYFARNWQKFSNSSGFVFLGLAMIVLGFNTLSNLNKEADSIQTLGLPLWRVVISAGIVVSLMGVFNIVATFVFSNSKAGITGRQVRSDGAAARPEDISGEEAGKGDYSIRSNSIRSHRSPVSPSLPSYNQTEAKRKSRFNLKLPIRTSNISKPISTNQSQFSKWNKTTQPVAAEDGEGLFHDRASPISPQVQRPPTAMHPAYKPPYESPYPVLRPPSSRYSVASGITRF